MLLIFFAVGWIGITGIFLLCSSVTALFEYLSSLGEAPRTTV